MGISLTLYVCSTGESKSPGIAYFMTVHLKKAIPIDVMVLFILQAAE